MFNFNNKFQNMLNINTPINRGKRSPRGPSRLQRSSSAAKRVKMTHVAEVHDSQPCNEMPPVPVRGVENRNVEEQRRQDICIIDDRSSWRSQIKEQDLMTAVSEFHVLSSKDLDKLIRDAENGTIKWTKSNGSFFEINVECLARFLGMHVAELFVKFTPEEEYCKYLLSGLTLLHNLYDIASNHTNLEEVLVQDAKVGNEMISLITSMITALSCFGEKITFSSQMVLLYSALLESSLHLLNAVLPSKWHTSPLILLAHPEVDSFTVAAFTAVHVVINFLHAEQAASRMKSNIDDVYCRFHLCESSLQFLQSLCQQMLIREHFVKNKKLCGEGVVLQLVKSIMKLQKYDDPHLMEVVYRLKSKCLYIMLHLCEVKSPSFLDMACSTTQSLDLAKSTVYEVLEVLRMMFCGNRKHHPRGILQLYAMQIMEILSNDSRFRAYINLNMTEVLARVFSQQQRAFLSTWCSNDREPAEEDIVVEFNPVSAAGQLLGLTSTSEVRHSTWRNFQPPRTPYMHWISSLLVKILVNLTCEDKRHHFIDAFLECLQKEFSRLPGGTAEGTAVASRNLYSLLAHAESLTLHYLNVEHVNALRRIINQLKHLLSTQDDIPIITVPFQDVQLPLANSELPRSMPASNRIHSNRLNKKVHNRGQCPSPTPRNPAPNQHHGRRDDQDELESVAMAMIQLQNITFTENGKKISKMMWWEKKRWDFGDL